MIKNEILNKIYNKHKSQLNYLNTPHKKLLICFSGIPGTGKTYIAKILEKKYKGVRISNDDVRKIIRNLGKKYPKLLEEDYKEEILEKYIMQLIKKPPFKNNLILLDSGIDRRYLEVFPISKLHGFDLFIIRIKASKRTAKKGVIKKLGKPDTNFINNIDRWVTEYKAFTKIITPDLKIKNKINRKLNTKKLFKALDKVIQTQIIAF